MAHWVTLFPQHWEQWRAFLPRARSPQAAPWWAAQSEKELRDAGIPEVLWAMPPSQHSPWSLPLSPAPHLAVRCLGGSPRIRPLVELAPPPLHFSCRPSPWPRPPLSSLMERGAQRGAQPLSLWNLLPRLSDGETIWSVLWAVEKAESRRMRVGPSGGSCLQEEGAQCSSGDGPAAAPTSPVPGRGR